ncbi:hypothetical protein E2562_028405 [Oryza meyeriana var. granulata]|uniref:Uncharacterized protein n=1 Tax=Oryza meyeriana var. granulata TaxID=110450 RepID=A0A6G1E368_9ORYZ|nr:hypothetical protein E2562_028405 [Oryza meyeriana var. granulata]
MVHSLVKPAMPSRQAVKAPWPSVRAHAVPRIARPTPLLRGRHNFLEGNGNSSTTALARKISARSMSLAIRDRA